MGNPFNTTVIPSPPVISPSPSSFGPKPPEIGPGLQVFEEPPPEPPHSSGKFKSLLSNKYVWIGIGGFLILIILALGLCFCVSKCCKKKSTVKVSKSERAKNSVLNDLKPSEQRENGKLACISFWLFKKKQLKSKYCNIFLLNMTFMLISISQIPKIRTHW